MDSTPAPAATTTPILGLFARLENDKKRYTEMLEWIDSRPVSDHPVSEHQQALRRKYKQLLARTTRRLRQEEHLRNIL